jgi:hypothetical protein
MLPPLPRLYSPKYLEVGNSPKFACGAFSEVVHLLVYPGARRSSTDRVVGKRTGEL